MRRTAVAAAAMALVVAGSYSIAAQHPILALLDDYAAGRHEEVIEAISSLDDVDGARKALDEGGRAWVRAAGSGAEPPRRLTLAVFALELAEAGQYKDWPSTMRLLDWTSDLVREGRPSEGERLWYRAAIAIHQGMRRRDIALIEPARERFPEDRRLAFAEVQSRAALSVRGWRQRSTEAGIGATARVANSERVLNDLLPFLDDAEIGSEAALWAGLMTLLNRNDPAGAMDYFADASRSRDPFVVYLAHYAAGRVQESAGRTAEAEAQYRRALSAIPRGQSASMSLSALLFVGDEPDAAYALIDDTFSGPPPPDPFQLYGFGDSWRLAGYMEQLRQAVRR